MAVTRIEVDGNFYMTYPSGYVFGRERNYIILEEYGEQVYINSIQFIKGDVVKKLNFGGFDLLKNKKLIIDISSYYSFGFNEIGYDYTDMDGTIFNDRVQVVYTFLDCYSPFLEFVPERCGDAQYARVVPPYRMLCDGKKSTTSMLAAVRDDDYFSGYEYEMEGVPYETYRPSDAWLTNAQKNEHLGETYRNTLKATGKLSDLDSKGNPLWIEQGDLAVGKRHYGKTFEEQRLASSNFCRTKTIFKNYNGLSIGATPSSMQKLVVFYDANKQYVSNFSWTSNAQTLNNASKYQYISITFSKPDNSAITPSELVGITSSAITNPEAGKSYRWVKQNGVFSWLELTKEQIINNSFAWYFGGKRYFDDVINKTATFEKSFEALYQRVQAVSPTMRGYTTIQKVSRSVSIADGSMPYVYIRWKTPWGVSVEHLFYLGTYSSDKADAKELESVNYYEELSQHVRVGSFYLDGITQPYDLFYYKTLENAELVEMYLPSYAFKPNTYMPNGSDYVAIKVKSSDVAEAVVDGVAQRVITFKFELS